MYEACGMCMRRVACDVHACAHVHVACGVWVWHVHVACACCACMRDGVRMHAHLQHLGVDPKLRHRLGRLQHLLHLGRLHQLPAASTHGR